MKKTLQLLAFLFFQFGFSQDTIPTKLYTKEFNWTIHIPEQFEKVSSEEWKKLQNKGKKAIEDTYGEKIINQSKTIFVFKNDQLNYLEATSQPYNKAVDGNFLASCKETEDILYQTFMDQIPGIKIDRSTDTEIIGGLDFHKFKMKILYPNKMIFTVIMYSRLFGKKEFTVNIMYVDNIKGVALLNAWRKSTF
jgi:hypothetical protein